MKRELTVGDVGEFELIRRLNANLGGRTGGVIAGVGDDTAVLHVAPGHLLLATCDAQIEGVHFLRHLTTPANIGWKAVSVNVSDIAAMAGLPRYALISLGLPSETPVAFVEGVYDGIRAAADAYQIDVVGGNVAGSPDRVLVDVTVLGEVKPDRVRYRRGARIGDVVLVTGHPGESAAGLALMQAQIATLPERVAERLRLAHLRPMARVKEALAASATGSVHAMIDLSDGLAPDLGHICEESQCGAVIDAEHLPVAAELRQAAAALGRDAVDFALRGGEDYELLLTVPPEAADDVARAIEQAGGVRVTAVGEIRPASEGLQLRKVDGSVEPMPGPLFRHFSSGERS